jgi:hypothetical protein
MKFTYFSNIRFYTLLQDPALKAHYDTEATFNHIIIILSFVNSSDPEFKEETHWQAHKYHGVTLGPLSSPEKSKYEKYCFKIKYTKTYVKSNFPVSGNRRTVNVLVDS